MKYIYLLIAMILVSTITQAQDGKATTIKLKKSRETSVSIEIKADEATIWKLLTNAQDFPRWNSTITSIEGNIALNEKIKLKSTLDAKRTFKLKVKEFEVNKRMVWSDKQGNRIYTLTKTANGNVLFSMTEKIGGFMFPLYANKIPSFDKSFEQFASDLKKEAEKNN
jgi:uncharacterized membrane protein